MNRFDIEYNSLRLCWYFLSFLLFGFLHVFFAFGPARKSGKILIPKLVMTRWVSQGWNTNVHPWWFTVPLNFRIWNCHVRFTRGYHLRMATPRNHQFRPLGSGAALHLQLPRHAMQGPWEPWALRTHHRMAAVLCYEALWIDFVEIETLWSLQFWVAQPGSKRGWSIHSSCLIYIKTNPFLVPIWGSQSQWDVDIVEGPGGSARWYGKIDWSIDLATRVRPYLILSEICAAMHLRSTTEGARCDLWFDRAPVFLGVGRLKFTERVYAWMILLYDSRWHCFLQCAW